MRAKEDVEMRKAVSRLQEHLTEFIEHETDAVGIVDKGYSREILKTLTRMQSSVSDLWSLVGEQNQ